MASINERKNKKKPNSIYIYYRHKDSDGKVRQITVSCKDRTEAKLLLSDIEKAESENRIYIKPATIKHIETVKELLEGYFTYKLSKNEWKPSTYDNYLRLRENYIIPMIGEIKIADVTRGFMYSYYDELRQKDALQGNHVNSPHVKISSRTIKEIDKILSPAFKWAVNREMISINPMYGMEKPTYNAPKRQQWTVEEFLSAGSFG